MDSQMQQHSEHELIERLVHQDHYTLEELSHVLGIGRHTIQHAVFSGELKAVVVDHHCLDVRREDAITWLNQRHDAG